MSLLRAVEWSLDHRSPWDRVTLHARGPCPRRLEPEDLRRLAAAAPRPPVQVWISGSQTGEREAAAYDAKSGRRVAAGTLRVRSLAAGGLLEGDLGVAVREFSKLAPIGEVWFWDLAPRAGAVLRFKRPTPWVRLLSATFMKPFSHAAAALAQQALLLGGVGLSGGNLEAYFLLFEEHSTSESSDYPQG